jgi:uncharacterized membrane protein
MNLTKIRIATLILIVGLISACGSQTVDSPASASQPSEEAVAVISSPTTAPAPSDTAAPTEAAQPAPADTVSFAGDVLPILQSRCLNCHGGRETEEGLSINSYADIMTGSDNGPVITPGNVENSLLAELVISQEMPKRGPKLTPPQVQIIVDWINQGALNN